MTDVQSSRRVRRAQRAVENQEGEGHGGCLARHLAHMW